MKIAPFIEHLLVHLLLEIPRNFHSLLRRGSEMKIMESYLQTSSIHGLRYLTTQNGLIVRLVWLVTIAVFFFCTALMIRQNVQESLEDPIATTTKIVPISKFPPPTISLTHSEEPNTYLHFYNILEQALNNLPFICQ